MYFFLLSFLFTRLYNLSFWLCLYNLSSWLYVIWIHSCFSEVSIGIEIRLYEHQQPSLRQMQKHFHFCWKYIKKIIFVAFPCCVNSSSYFSHICHNEICSDNYLHVHRRLTLRAKFSDWHSSCELYWTLQTDSKSPSDLHKLSLTFPKLRASTCSPC